MFSSNDPPVDPILEMKNLKEIDYDGFDDEALAKLREARPDLKIIE